ncbi:hypothetical protein JYU34_015099 [Plutella xylostella]|uniref:Uncharacterized protein n=1 Tax=Plutella xylostella TaxID=51655 RepID=A0ABQ7PQG2_PLUXY|nr:uncharacterized protein LOC125489830 isoform X2 [Plutella xylostella]KAG7295221.1 hypothetical protein JYU34_022193 [Plutella xylostella]KAG7300770.1 hypothetical protein JYU34_015099 [Plutella xylostella]
MEQDLKRLIAARGQLKGTITRLYNFISNETEFNKDSQNCEDFERIENQYFAIMAAINEKLTPKTNCESNVQPFLRPWLRLAIAMLTLPE